MNNNKIKFSNVIKHFKTITTHKIVVMKHCFRLGLYWQGLLHDLSKYTPTEFLVGAKYYQGTKSPNVMERHDKGFSEAWLHHKGRNKHHFEYWIDYSSHAEVPTVACPMPKRYLLEMFCDRVAACKIYNGANYTDADAYNYLKRSKENSIMNEDTKRELYFLLTMLKDKGEDYTFNYINKVYKKRK